MSAAGEHNQYNSRNADPPVRDGLLLLFPACLDHSVAGKGERVSISFSIMFERSGEAPGRSGAPNPKPKVIPLR